MVSATLLAALPSGMPPAPRLAPPRSPGSVVPLAAATGFHARQQFSSLEAWLSAPPTLQLPLHQIERQQELKGRDLQRLLLQAHVQQRGNGDVGPALRVTEQSTTFSTPSASTSLGRRPPPFWSPPSIVRASPWSSRATHSAQSG